MTREFEDFVYPVPLGIDNPGWTRVRKRLFTARQSAELVRLAEDGRFYRSTRENRKRVVDICYLEPDECSWAYEKISKAFVTENAWGFHLSAMVEPIRIQRYRVGGFTRQHTDYDYAGSDQSKITAIVPIVPRRSWTGGELLIGESQKTPAVERGDALFFPSFAPHEVTRVTKGERWVLSAWVAGPRLI